MLCRQLNAAKGKLQRLQELVALVQQSPELAANLPDDLADLDAGSEDKAMVAIQRAPASSLAESVDDTEEDYCAGCSEQQ